MIDGRARTWTPERLLAVLDIGKSNAKIVLVDPRSGTALASVRRPNVAVAGDPVRQLDLEGLRDWLFETLAALPERHRIGAIVPVAHGAACVMLGRDDGPLLAPDYEDPSLGGSDAYDRLRDPFDRTFSPRLPGGLNLGRQIHFVAHAAPALFARVACILTYPQYWSFVLCGVKASEITSLGCHTDLWWPGAGGFSACAVRAGWADLFAPVRAANEALGVILPSIAADCGLPADCLVLCGIHDSNASYLRHRIHRADTERFAVISSGTWTVILSNGTRLDRLDPERDMLANVDALGGVVGTVRFMGGREYEAVAGADAPPPTVAGLKRALAAGASVTPSLAPGGQFPGRVGQVAADGLDAEARAALATLHVARLTDVALDLLDAGGDVVIDGPLSRNPLYPAVLACLRPSSAIRLDDETAGSVGGARCLLLGPGIAPPSLRRVCATDELERVAAADAFNRPSDRDAVPDAPAGRPASH